MQHHSDVYRGTFDAFRKIVKTEGTRGLYRGFWVSAFQVVSGVAYVSTYEGVRHGLEKSNVTNSMIKAFVGGGMASVVGQTIIVPFDVISQHLMLIGQKSKYKASANAIVIETEGRSKAQIVYDITKTIYQKDGFKGYYRGYFASLCTYVPSSASWWTFYHFFQDFYGLFLPSFVPLSALQCLAAMSSGCASSAITNPLDLVRARVQVQRRSIPETIRYLWRTERYGIFTKGLTARMSSSVIYSMAIIFGYESVKRFSVYEEYKDRIRW